MRQDVSLMALIQREMVRRSRRVQNWRDLSQVGRGRPPVAMVRRNIEKSREENASIATTCGVLTVLSAVGCGRAPSNQNMDPSPKIDKKRGTESYAKADPRHDREEMVMLHRGLASTTPPRPALHQQLAVPLREISYAARPGVGSGALPFLGVIYNLPMGSLSGSW